MADSAHGPSVEMRKQYMRIWRSRVLLASGLIFSGAPQSLKEEGNHCFLTPVTSEAESLDI
jgi:hypothetical protein